MLAPTATRRLIREFAGRRPHTPRPDLLSGLTDREQEILTLIAWGRTNKEIADELIISPLTAKTHVRNILQKLDCRDRAALTALAYEAGLVTPGESRNTLDP